MTLLFIGIAVGLVGGWGFGRYVTPYVKNQEVKFAKSILNQSGNLTNPKN